MTIVTILYDKSFEGSEFLLIYMKNENILVKCLDKIISIPKLRIVVQCFSANNTY